MTRSKRANANVRLSAITLVVAASLWAATLVVPAAAGAYPGNPAIPTNPGTPSAQFPGNPG